MVAVAHHPMEIQPWLQMLHPGDTRSLSRDHRHHLETKEEERARSSVIGAANVTAVLVRREPAQHGVGSVAFAMARTITGQSVGRPLKDKREVDPNPSIRSRGKANLLANHMEKQRPNLLTP